ncbi:MAG TPA: hypothetical protein VIJ14_07955 [Rhabdochlamydiaceae bacterium]
MVQILPPKTNLGTQFGQALGGGLEQGLKKGVDIAFQKGILNQAFSDLKNLPKDASPFDKYQAFVQGTIGLPDQGRILQGFAPFINAQSTGKKGGEVDFPPGGGSNGIPGKGENNQTNATQNVPLNKVTDPQQFLVRANEELGGGLPPPSYTPDLFQGTLDPTSLGLGPVPPQYSPEEILQARTQDMQQGFPDSPRASIMEQYNEKSRERTADIVKAAQIQSDISTRASTRQNDQRDFVSAELGIPLNNRSPEQEGLLSVAENVGARPEYRNIANDKIRADRIAQEVRKYQAAHQQFKESSQRPNPILNREKYYRDISNNKAKAKTLIDFGKLDETFKDLANGGWSVSEIAKQVAPLSEEVNKNLEAVTPVPYENGKYSSDPKKSYDSMYNYLEKNIKPGKFNPKNPSAVEPGTSLVLSRNGLLKKGFGYNEIDTAISNLVNQGKLNLDPYQNIEFQYMKDSPSKTLSIYEILFE